MAIEPEDHSAPPALYDHCVQIWQAMHDESKGHQIEEDNNARVYEGYLTKLFTKQHLSVPYYTSVMNALKQMDCVRQLKRGGGGAPSQWLMVQPPNKELFELARGKVTTGRAKQDGNLQMINDLNRRVSILEEVIGRLYNDNGEEVA